MVPSSFTENTAVAIPRWFLGLVSVLLIPGISLVGYLVVNAATVNARVAALENSHASVQDALADQTREIIGLRLQIERLLVISPADVYRKLEELERKVQVQTQTQAKAVNPS